MTQIKTFEDRMKEHKIKAIKEMARDVQAKLEKDHKPEKAIDWRVAIGDLIKVGGVEEAKERVMKWNNYFGDLDLDVEIKRIAELVEQARS